MSWLVLSILSAVALGLYDVAKKAALQENAVLPVLFACSATGAFLVLPWGAVSLLAPEFALGLGIVVQALDLRGHLLVLAKAAIVTLSWTLTYFGLKHLPISLAAPVRASAPLFVLLGALALFREAPTAAQWAGIAVLFASYWGFSLLGRAEGIRFERNRWVWLLFAGTLVGAGSGLYDKHLLQSAALPPVTVQFWFTLDSTLLQGLLVGAFWWPRRSATTPFRWRAAILAVAVLLLLADYAYFRAVAIPGALISVVSIARRANVVISFGVGGLAFRERNRLPKAGALAGVILGVALLLA
ncbi:MAG: EamA family transporter [Deltaproteobacteria bacterium]|nr:EamA family transporter [Deltaproteobacteria bacterium]